MKKLNVILLMLALLTGKGFAQTCGTVLSCPTNSCACGVTGCVAEVIDPAYDILAYCSATGQYDCHQYTRACLYYQQSSTILPSQQPYVFDCISGFGLCPCSNFSDLAINNDAAFVKVCDITKAQAIAYGINHSGIINYGYSSTGKVASKNYPYGGILVTDPNHWNYLGTQTYYAFIGALTGPTTLAANSVYSVMNRDGLTYQWSAEPANMVAITGGTTNSATISPVCGTGKVKISVTVTGVGGTDCTGGSVTQCMEVNVETSKKCPCTTGYCSIGGSYTSNSTTYTLSTSASNPVYSSTAVVTINCGSTTALTYSWTQTGGSGTYTAGTVNNQVTISLPPGQAIVLNITATDRNGCIADMKTVSFYRASGLGRILGNSNEVLQADEEVDSRTFSSSDARTFDKNIFTVIPNPVQSSFQLSATRPIASTIELSNSLGSRMLNMHVSKDNYPNTVDVSNLPNGIYFLKISTVEGEVSSLKVVVEH